MILCSICQKEITDPTNVYKRVTGWERPGHGATGKSGSSLELRKRTGDVAHPECLVQLKFGMNVTQEALL